MAQNSLFPFRRVSVDHMVRGTTRVWWQLDPRFNEPGPYVFQLQVGKTGLRDADDWRSVGDPVTNAYLAYDPEWRSSGYELLSHYRVTLTTPTNLYVSQAASCFGELNERDWVLSREIIRKELLRHKYVSVPGYLLKRMRFGKPCDRCRDPLTQETTDSDCPQCNGVGFDVGYHPPLAMQCWDLSPQVIQEKIDSQLRGNTRDNSAVTARVIGFPALNKRDIWVNGASDERWMIDGIQIAAAMRNVPLVYSVQLSLLPFTNRAYAIEVGGEAASRPGPDTPFEGCGNIVVDHNYGGADKLAYVDATHDPVVGATVYVFTKAAYDAAYPALPNRALAVARTTTTANGRWTIALLLNAGDYALLYEKPGEYGPDMQFITVAPSDSGVTCVWYPPLPIGEEDDDPATVAVNETEYLLTEDEEEVTTDTEQKVCGPTGTPLEMKKPPKKQPPPPPPKPKQKPKSNDDFWAI